MRAVSRWCRLMPRQTPGRELWRFCCCIGWRAACLSRCQRWYHYILNPSQRWRRDISLGVGRSNAPVLQPENFSFGPKRGWLNQSCGHQNSHIWAWIFGQESMLPCCFLLCFEERWDRLQLPPKPPQTLWFIISIPPILIQSRLFKDQDMWINDILAMWFRPNDKCQLLLVNTHLFQLLMVYCLLGLPHLSSCKVIPGYFCFRAYHCRDV